MFASLSLIALVLGYKVFVDASKEKEGLKILGQGIGVLVMVGSVALLLLGSCPKYGGYFKRGYSMMSNQKGGCCLMKSEAPAG